MLQHLVRVCLLTGVAATSHAQTLQLGTLMRFQVWNGTQWSSSTTAMPGSQVEYRISMSYSGTAANIVGFGSARYQPIFSNAINTGLSIDTHAPFRNGGASGDSLPGSLLSAAEGASGASLASYGRVGYGSTVMAASSLNTLTQFRHGGGAPINNAPPGSFIRLAGSDVSSFPFPTIASAVQATPVAINMIARGVASSQRGPIESGVQNTSFVAGLQNVVIFRGAMQLAAGNADRTMTISNAEGSLLRGRHGVDPIGSADDTRYVMWWASNGNAISTRVVTLPASVQIIPSPGATPLAVAALVVVTRRRRGKSAAAKPTPATFV